MVFVLFVTQIKAQTDIPVNTWRTHNAYNKTIALTATEGSVVAATNSAIYSYNPQTGATEQITSLSGLSDANITTIGYNAQKSIIIVAYANGNIDFISDSKITNFKDLLLAEIPGSKRVNHIYSYNDFVYLSADFGVMIIDLDRNEVNDSYFELGKTGNTITVHGSIIQNDSLYLATDEGVIGGDLNDNLKDFNLWRRYNADDGMPESVTRVLVPSGEGLLAAFDEFGLFEFDNSIWTDLNLLKNRHFINGSESNARALLVSDSVVYVYTPGQVDSLDFELINEPKSAISFTGSTVVGDFLNGMLFPETEQSYYPDGPIDNDIVRLFGFENSMVALPRAYTSTYQPLRSSSGYSIFTGGEWSNYNSTGYPGTISIPEFLDITDAMYSYASRSLYLASFGYGIMEINEDGYIIYNDSNSTLINTNPPGNNVSVTALDANSKVLSAINFNATTEYHSLDFPGEAWTSAAVSFPAARADQLRGFENNTFWIKSSPLTGGGIIVFDSENNRELLLDDEFLPSSFVYDLAIDREGKMWVATERGVVFFYNAEFILDQTFIDPVQPIYDGQILFRNERITALAVDGGNRIWMATTTGVWLFASDGLELVYYFNSENSPLPSNNIRDISINHQNGEVFFATDNGLISYRADATISTVQEPLKIFPNPVILARHDVVAIQGVPTDADFWITDSSGRLVYKSKANGNNATWQGISSNTQLSSGVYFVFVSTDTGDEKQVGKIAIVN